MNILIKYLIRATYNKIIKNCNIRDV